jgi:hypothetical protein
MPRVCQCGCGRKLDNRRKRFYEAECRNKDKRELMQERRKEARKRPICPFCGRVWHKPAKPKAKAAGV